MIVLIASIILVISFLGMLVIFWRKIPVLITLPPEVKTGKESLFSRVKNRAISVRPIKAFSFEALLQKILSKIRVLSLKVENKTADHLHKLRKNSQKKNELGDESYWEELKKPLNDKSNKEEPSE